MEIAGYIASLLIGITLGLIGGGGSILTLPVLVYLMGVEPSTAVFYSLFIVGVTSLTGAVRMYYQKHINLKVAFSFGIASIITVIIIRKVVLPYIPVTIVLGQGLSVAYSTIVLVVFALLMLFASLAMIKPSKTVDIKPGNFSFFSLVKYGLGIGLLTGFLGAGGGFLLIPALVIVMHVPMKQAIGTSLLIIAMNTLFGFVADVTTIPIEWSLLLKVSALAIAGIFIGTALGKKINAVQLKKSFGWFVLVMGLFIIVKELFF
jgi:uncharacterized protein